MRGKKHKEQAALESRLHSHRVDCNPGCLHKNLIRARRRLFQVINDLRFGALVWKNDTLHCELFLLVYRELFEDQKPRCPKMISTTTRR